MPTTIYIDGTAHDYLTISSEAHAVIWTALDLQLKPDGAMWAHGLQQRLCTNQYREIVYKKQIETDDGNTITYGISETQAYSYWKSLLTMSLIAQQKEARIMWEST